jgi:hypothetical protein
MKQTGRDTMFVLYDLKQITCEMTHALAENEPKMKIPQISRLSLYKKQTLYFCTNNGM